jgi:class 3 adenylate cyclase
MSPDAIRYAAAHDGVSIAYERMGTGPPLLYARGWITHLELQRRTPAIERFFAPLREHREVLRYDTRGNGLSSWDVPLPVTKEAVLSDLATVADMIDEPFDLWATTYAGPPAIEYAARHPERVRRLILDGTFLRGRHFLSEDRAAPFFEMLSMARHSPEVVFSALSFMTDPAPEITHEVRVERLRQSISPDVIGPLYRLAHEYDVNEIAAEVHQPTLVMHRERSRAVPVRAAQRLAARLPNASLCVLDGDAHNLHEGDWRSPLRAVGEFLGIEVDLGSNVAITSKQTSLSVVMFTDMVGSTAMTSRFGDHVSQLARRRHDDAVREALRRCGGTEIKHTGDGIMASFHSVVEAARAAMTISDSLDAPSPAHEPELAVKIGLNAGEPVRDGADLFGSSVQVAARACERAGAGEIVVTGVVRELLRGKSALFEDHGLHDLKGVDGPVQLWRLVELTE